MSKYKKIINITCCIIIIVLSVIVGKFWVNPENHSEMIEYLDKKNDNVVGLTATAATISTAISLVPGDTGIPVANQLMDFSFHFLIILCGLYLEKYLLILSGYFSFYILIPVACCLAIINNINSSENLKKLSIKCFVFSIAIIITIPLSVQASKIIESTYKDISSGIILDKAVENSEEIKKDTDEKEGFLSGIFNTTKDIVDDISSSTSNLIDKATDSIGDFVEFIAVMIITSCIMPLIVFVVLIWGSKLIFNLDYDFKKVVKKYKNRKIKSMNIKKINKSNNNVD